MPHLVFFPQRSPETYSYSLSEAYAANLPVLVPEIGSFPERTAGARHTWTYPLTASPDAVVGILDKLRSRGVTYQDVLAGLGDLGLRPPLAPMEGPNVEARERGTRRLRELLARPRP